MDYQHEELIKEAIADLEQTVVKYTLPPTPCQLINNAIRKLILAMQPTDEVEQQFQEDYHGHEREG
jgi:hypothetical protein